MAFGTLMGNIAADATSNKVSDKQDAVNFTIVINKQRKNPETGNYEDLDADFHNCVRYVEAGKGAEIAAKMEKGRHYIVEGTYQTSKDRDGNHKEHGAIKFRNKPFVVENMKPTGKAKDKAA
ncbi:single-stranded DNA-binding protein [Pseudomonas serbica]|jgi:single-stranded DNA-binding protein|uniref:single-stranded DNA-binding protein n=1 Tax=Pseudomonas serbica TaxID=2965074 RepID=UPI00237B4587|nr:single-stranded DNA-binding protein [Pseudomonas serbica]